MVYPEHFEKKIGFSRIRELVGEQCASASGSRKAAIMQFMTGRESVVRKLKEVAELSELMEGAQGFEMGPVPDIATGLEKIGVEGRYLEPEELKDLRTTLDTARTLVSFIAKQDGDEFPAITDLAAPVRLFPYLSERIEAVLNRQGKIRDSASKELQSLRTQIAARQSAAAKTLSRLLQQAQADGLTATDAAASLRNGRPVIPVEASSKRRLRGIVHDQSASGRTIFIEPEEVVEVNNEIRELEYAEHREVIRILLQVTDDFRPYLGDLESIGDFLGEVDFIMAKALFAKRMGAVMPSVTEERQIDWQEAVHPLLYLALKKEGRDVVPLDIMLDRNQRILVVSGPNAGGKSVCLKTVGLLQYMLQCGMLIPVGANSRSGIFERLFLDIGDEQSIENDLSTYSSHLRSMSHFIRNSDPATLVLIDEFGAGTEPMLGGAIAEAVLEKINDTGCFGLITTHYGNLKHFAATAEGIENAAMLFDSQELKPLFKMVMGQPGSSYAFEIARSTGLPDEVIRLATDKVGEEHRNFDRHLREIVRDRKYWESKRDRIRQSEKRLQQVLSEYATELELTRDNRKKIIDEARKQAGEMLSGTNRMIENTIRRIRESQAEKEQTRKIREEFGEFREGLSGQSVEDEPKIRKKIDKVRQEEEKVKERRRRFGQLEPARKVKKKQIDATIRAGDYVVLKGQETPGEVVRVSGAKARVNFGHLSSSVELDRLDKIEPERYREHVQKSVSKGDYADWDPSRKRLEFSPDIDIRGQRAEAAIRSVSEFLDEAVMVGAGELRILHGKGDGILRQIIREYLDTLDFVGSYRDEHVQLGGAGITVITLNP